MAGKKLQMLPRQFTNESWPDRAELLRMDPLRSILDATLSDPECIPPDIFDTDRVQQLIDLHMTRKGRFMRPLLCLLSFGRWFRKYGPRSA
jgi:hypothetical protein